MRIFLIAACAVALVDLLVGLASCGPTYEEPVGDPYYPACFGGECFGGAPGG